MRSYVLFVSLWFCAGCVPVPKDISDLLEIQASGVLGRQLELTRDQPLTRLGSPFPRFTVGVMRSQRAAGGPEEHHGVLAAGTRLRVTRVYYGVTYNAFFQCFSRLTFAEIETGPEAGREVDLGWGVVPDRDDWPNLIGFGPYRELRPATRASQ